MLRHPYKRRAARPAAANKPGIAVCIAAPPAEEEEDAADPSTEVAEPIAELALDATELAPAEALASTEEAPALAADSTDETLEDASEATDDAPDLIAVATDVNSVETSEVNVDPSETMVDARVEIAERPRLASLVEKMVVLPTVVSMVLDPVVMMEMSAEVVIGIATP